MAADPRRPRDAGGFMIAPILLLVLAALGASAADGAEARRIVAAGPAVTETI